MQFIILLACAAILANGKAELDMQDVIALQALESMNGNNPGGSGTNTQFQQELGSYMMMGADPEDLVTLELMGGFSGSNQQPHAREKFLLTPETSAMSKDNVAAISGEEELMNYIASESLANGGTLSPLFLQEMLDGNYLQNELQDQLVKAGVDPYNLFGVEDKKLALQLHTLQHLEEAGVSDPFALNTLLEGNYVYLKSIMNAVGQGASPVLAKSLAESKYQQFQTLESLEATGVLNPYYVTLFGGEEYAQFKAMNQITQELMKSGIDMLTAEKIAFEASQQKAGKVRSKQQGMPESMYPYMMMQGMQGGGAPGGMPGGMPMGGMGGMSGMGGMGGMGGNPMMNPYLLQSDMMENLGDMSMKDMMTMMPMMQMMGGGMGGMGGGMPGMSMMGGAPPQPPMRNSMGDNLNDMFETAVDKPMSAYMIHNMFTGAGQEGNAQAGSSPGSSPGFSELAALMGKFGGPKQNARGSMVEEMKDSMKENPILGLGMLGGLGMMGSEAMQAGSANANGGMNMADYPSLQMAQQWFQQLIASKTGNPARGSPLGYIDSDMVRLMLMRNLLSQDQNTANTNSQSDPSLASLLQSFNNKPSRGNTLGFISDYLEMGDGGFMNIALLSQLMGKMNPQAATGPTMRGGPQDLFSDLMPLLFLKKLLGGQEEAAPQLRGLTSMELPFELEMLDALMGAGTMGAGAMMGSSSGSSAGMNPFASMGPSPFGGGSSTPEPSASSSFGLSNAVSMMQMAKLLAQLQKNGFGGRQSFSPFSFNPMDRVGESAFGKYLVMGNLLKQMAGQQAGPNMRGFPNELFDNPLIPFLAWNQMKPDGSTPTEAPAAEGEEQKFWMLLPDQQKGGLAWKLIPHVAPHVINKVIENKLGNGGDAVVDAPVTEETPVTEDSPAPGKQADIPATEAPVTEAQ